MKIKIFELVQISSVSYYISQPVPEGWHYIE